MDLKETINQELEKKSNELIVLNDELIKITNQLNPLRVELSGINAEIQAAKQLKLKNESVISNFEEQRDLLLAKIGELNRDIETLRLVIKNDQQAVAELQHQRVEQEDKVKKLDKVIADKTSEISSLNQKIESLVPVLPDFEQKISAHKNTIKQLESHYAEMQAASEKQLAETQALKEAEWSARDGETSKREEILKIKKEHLIKVKNELEIYFNKTINIII
jgi:chromosome segregation ATPase